MSSDINVHVQIMQDNLCELRKIAAWSAEKLANKLGTTKQTVSNIETKKVTLTRMQYIAIRAIFECEIVIQRENTTLRRLMWLLFENPTDIYMKYGEEIRTAMVSVAAIASAGISGLQLYSSTVSLLSSLGHICSVPIINRNEPSLQWLTELLEEPVDEESEITKENENEND